MASKKLAAVTVAFALCSSPIWSQTNWQLRSKAQVPRVESPRQFQGSDGQPEAEVPTISGVHTDAHDAPSPTTEARVSDSLLHHSAVESSSLSDSSDMFSHSSAATTEAAASARNKSGSPVINKFRPGLFNHFAIGVKVSTLGAGLEVATTLSRSFNLRSSFNYAKFKYDFDVDGINYETNVNFASGQIGVDWFPFHGGFHMSPGLLYFHNALSGTANVPAGRKFTLEDTDYINSVDDPVSGTASVIFRNHVAPVLTVGWGNLIPRSGRHFSVPFELGAAYTGAGIMDIKLAGTACTRDGCFNAATDPGTQNNLQQELNDLNKEVKKFQFYPIISLGFAYRF